MSYGTYMLYETAQALTS